ncbi:hypothetical protein E2C01_077119 [Portunus trituberculatus]|uniref:Uncharacterized protein n=1 Tax=Portunus trituberculatus TaxID=210409 RepID=A0A5B7IAJ9_PORTR|nr:hypothetical protein [Portunus trituberculatus]
MRLQDLPCHSLHHFPLKELFDVKHYGPRHRGRGRGTTKWLGRHPEPGEAVVDDPSRPPMRRPRELPAQQSPCLRILRSPWASVEAAGPAAFGVV